MNYKNVMVCGCIIIHDTTKPREKIDYCPKHRAAPDMYEALKAANNLLNGYTSANDNEQLKITIRMALAKAEGK